MRRALDIDERIYGAEHPDVAIDLSNLASLLQATNRLAEAEQLMGRTVRIFAQFGAATGHPHPHLNVAVNKYVDLLRQMGRDETEIRVLLEGATSPSGRLARPPH